MTTIRIGDEIQIKRTKNDKGRGTVIGTEMQFDGSLLLQIRWADGRTGEILAEKVKPATREGR